MVREGVVDRRRIIRVTTLAIDIDKDKLRDFFHRRIRGKPREGGVPMGKCAIASSALLLLVVACSTTTAQQPQALRVSSEETLTYLRARVVGWEANDGDNWVRYDSVTLTDCVLTVSQSRNTKSGVHTLHHEYPLNLVGEAKWFPTLGSSGVLMVAGGEGAVIRLRWNRETAATYMKFDLLELPPEYGERITKAFNHLKTSCVQAPDNDPFR